jgi:hypothetical protein
MTAGSFATAAITHAGPLTENPFSAKAASVPSAPVRFSRYPAPSFSFTCAMSLRKDSFSCIISAVNSWNSCLGSRVEMYPASRASADRYSAAPPEPASASQDARPFRAS